MSSATKPSATKQITIIGCGLAGALLAVLLAKRNYQVSVFEKRPDMRKIDISAGRSINLALANRGIAPLEAAGVMSEIKPILTSMVGRMIHDDKGNQNLQKYGQTEQEVIYSVSRGDLNKILMDKAEQSGHVKLIFDADISKIDVNENKIFYSDSENSHEHEFQRIIGADGAGSITRKALQQLYDDVESEFSTEPLDHGYKELTFPSQKGDYAIEPHALHIWPRGEFMLIALPNEDKSFTVTLFLPQQGKTSFETLDSEEKVAQFFNTYFADAKKLLPDLNRQFVENPTGKLATVRCNRWHWQDKILLIGDAAHAVVPFHGQGMNCAFEDCLELVKQLDSEDDNWTKIIPQFASLRKHNADAIADMALENYIEMRSSVRDKKYLLKKELAFKLEQQFPHHFIPRYSMVMFHHLPYSDAYKRGKIQQLILEQLTQDQRDITTVDMKLAARLILQKLTAIIEN